MDNESRQAEHEPATPMPDPLAADADVSAPAAPVPLAWNRFAIAAEFLVSLLTITVVWSTLGGQGHIDLMPWYVKVGLPLMFSIAVCRATLSSMRSPMAFPPGAVIWILLALISAGAMGLVTYYYHLQEELLQPEPDGESLTSISIPGSLRA
jgi:hypothetical protein